MWPLQAAFEYSVDAWQRYVLTLDVLRERGNQYLEHSRSGKPPVLAFEYDVVMDARDLPKPANYALVRIRPDAGQPASDPKKRPFVVIDPRAGHGPGIGGFKMDSEIGIALQQGHPCYFVMFYPDPVPGQTIECVCAAEIAFMRKVNELHPDADNKPLVIGNCQGGWALIMLASLAPQEVGPLLLAGSPVSYWAGVEGRNPMRYSGGLLGGTWMASLAGDMGHGKFDGAMLVNNFEGLNPSNTLWGKLYNLYSKVDTERDRFLEFERWWGGHFLMNKEEMEWITRNLFVGNRLSAGKVESFDGKHRVDIRNIRTPIVVFASWGDNITPPQQALNWIPDTYASVEEICLDEQTIVYCLHEKIGHLGIFVSAGVARRETSELVSALDLIETLPPGLYEALITDTQPDMPGLAYVKGRYLIEFAERTTDDILALDDGRKDEQAFEVVDRVSQVNQHLYDTFASPVVKAMSNETAAHALRIMNPARMERWAFSNLNPWMYGVQALAAKVREERKPAAPDNPFTRAEHEMSGRIEKALDDVRDSRDATAERMFKTIYESPWLAAAVGLDSATLGRRQVPKPETWEQEELRRLKRQAVDSQFEQGSLLDGWARMLLYARKEDKIVDERPYNLVRELIGALAPERRPTPAALKAAIKRQAFILALDEPRAVAGLPALVPQMQQRRDAMQALRQITSVRGKASAYQEERLGQLSTLFSLDAPRRPRRVA